MKGLKWMLLLSAMALVWTLAACAGAAPAEEDSGAPGAEQGAAMGTFSEADLVFVLEGVSYPLNSDAAPLLKAFGPDYELTAATSCRYEGEDKMFVYEFATVYTYPVNGKDMIDEIYIKGGDYETAKGIGIGSTLEDVEAAYGEGGFEIDGVYTYLMSGDPDNKKSAQLYFEISDDEVVGFGYYAASNVVE